MADQRATLTLKLGGNEIRYEAERGAVEAKLDHVLDRLLQAAGDPVQVGIAGTPSVSATPPPATPSAPPEAVEAWQLEQVFAIVDLGEHVAHVGSLRQFSARIQRRS